MADKTKTIKESTDKELDDLIARLRKENEAQNLISTLKRASMDGYMPYDQQQGISMEKPIDSMYHVDKTKSIKELTDKELGDLIIRLRKETEVQGLISDIKRKSLDGCVPYDQQQGISTEKPIDSMYHIGILGMKWGHRKGTATLPGLKLGQKSATPASKASKDHETKLEIGKKKLKEMTNEELSAYIKRRSLEQQYHKITKDDIGLAKKLVRAVVGKVTTVASDKALSYVEQQAAKRVDVILKKLSTKAVT